MKVLLNFFGTAALGFALVSFVCMGHRPAKIGVPASVGIRADDAAFLTGAAASEMMEVEIGQLAQINSLDPALRDLSSKMVRDHGQGGDRIKALSAKRNITLPAGLSDDQKKIKEGLQKKTGTEFDKEYIDLVIDDHIKSIRQFEKEAANGSDKEIKAFADSSLQVMHNHLDAAQNYRKTTIKG